VISLQHYFQLNTFGYLFGNTELNVSSPLNERFIDELGIRHDFIADM